MHPSLLKMPEVVQRTGQSRSTIYNEVKRGVFPRPIKVGRRTYWRDEEITRIVDAYSAGVGASGLQEISRCIVQRRLQLRA